MTRFTVWFFAALRYFNAAGATKAFGEDHRIETHLIPCVLQVPLGKREHAQVFGTDYPTPDGSCIRDYIHVTDLAQAHALALEVKESGFFNLGIGGGVSVLEVIEACRKVTGKDIPIVNQARRPGDPPRLIASAQKAREGIGLATTVRADHGYRQQRMELAPSAPKGI